MDIGEDLIGHRVVPTGASVMAETQATTRPLVPARSLGLAVSPIPTGGDIELRMRSPGEDLVPKNGVVGVVGEREKVAGSEAARGRRPTMLILLSENLGRLMTPTFLSGPLRTPVKVVVVLMPQGLSTEAQVTRMKRRQTTAVRRWCPGQNHPKPTAHSPGQLLRTKKSPLTSPMVPPIQVSVTALTTARVTSLPVLYPSDSHRVRAM